VSTKREIAIGLAIAAVIAPLYAVVVVVADFGRDAFYIGACAAIAIALLILDVLTDDGRPRRFRLIPHRRVHHSHRR